MIGLDTVINAVGVLVGGFLGLFTGKVLKELLQDILICASGIAYIFISVSGALQRIRTSGTALSIIRSQSQETNGNQNRLILYLSND